MSVDTKTQILDAAESLISEKGIDAVSLRAITAAASVNLAAVHYHFGSKEALVGKVYERRLGPINQLRLQMLDDVESAAGDGPPDLDGVLRALVEPPIRMYFEHEKSSLFMQLCGRIYAEPAEFVQAMFDGIFQEIAARFTVAFERALPELDDVERGWRVQFALGSMIHTLLDSERLARFTDGKCKLTDSDAVIDRLVNFTAAGMRAPAASPEPPSPQPTRLAPVAAVVALSAVALGCTQTLDRPDHALSVQAQAPQAWTVPASDPGEVQDNWWSSFADPQLDEAVSHGLEHSKDLSAALARIEAAQAQARIARAADRPEIEASFSRSRARQNFVGLPFPGLAGNVLSTTNTNLGLNFGLSWEADVWGRVKSGKIAALADVDAAQAELMGARLSLTGQTTKAWFLAIEANRQVQLARVSLESYAISARQIRDAFQAGTAETIDVRLSLTEVDRAKASLQQRLQQRDASVRALEALIGKYPAGEYALGEDLPEPPAMVPAGLPSDLVHRRPDLVAAERRLLAADARIAQAKADLKPRFSLTSSTGTLTNKFQQVLSGDVFVWSLVGGVTQPLLNRARLKGAVSQNEAVAHEVAAQYESALLNAYREVEVSLAADQYLIAQEQALESATRQALAAQTLAQDRYRAGLIDVIAVLDSQRTALDSESGLLTVRRARLDNRVDLHLALGGGFKPTMVATAEQGDQSQ